MGKDKGKKGSNVEVNFKLKTICDKGNSRGLIRYIISNMNGVQTLRNELKVALSNAPDAAKLVIKALERYDFSDDSNRRACILLLESLFPVFGNDGNAAVPSDVKNSAREIAKAWREGMAKAWREGMDTNCSLDSQAFLQLLVSFRIAADYEKDELLGILFHMSSHKHVPELFRSLGLSPDVDFISKVSKNRGPLIALRLAHTFGMMDKVHPVGLLTSHLRDVDEYIAKGLVTRTCGTDGSKPQNQMYRLWRNANSKKIGVLSSVLNLVEMYGLQCDSFKANLQKELRNLEQEKVDGLETIRAGKIKASEIKAKQKGEKTDEKKAQEETNGEKAAEKKAQAKEDGEKDAEKKAQEKENKEKAAEKKAQVKEDGMKAAEKKAQVKKYRRKAAEKEAQEKGNGEKASEKKAQEKENGEKASEKKAQVKEDGEKAAEKKAQEKAAEKKAQAKEDGTKDAEKKAQAKKYRSKAAEKEAQEKEDRKKAAEKKAQQKRRQSFEPGYGVSEKGNYASKRAKHASPNETARVAGGMYNSKASLYNIDRVHNKSGIIGHDHHPSAFSAAYRSSTGLAAGAFTSAPSIAAPIHDARRGHEGYPSALGTSNLTPVGSSLYSAGVPAGAFAVPLSNVAEVNYEGRGQQSYMSNFDEVDKYHDRASVYGTVDLAKSSATKSNLTPVGSSLYSSGVPAGAFAVPLSNVAEVNYEGRGQQSYMSNFGEVDKYHDRASVYGTVDLAKSSATETNYNFEGRCQQNYKLNFGEIDSNPVRASAYATAILANTSATQFHYERKVPELYTSTFGGGLTASIGSSLYGSNPRTISSSDVNQGSYERSPGQYSGFAGRNMVPVVSSGYGSGVSTVPPSNVTQGHFERRGSVIDKYQFNSGYTSSLPPAN